MLIRPFKYLQIVFLCFLAAACATRYVEGDINKSSAVDSVGDVVLFESSQSIVKIPPKCLGVLPFSTVKKEFEPTVPFRKAVHAHLATTGINMVPLEKIDQQSITTKPESQDLSRIGNALGCETFVSAEVTEKKTNFYGVYSEVKIGAILKVINVRTGETLWKGRHTAVARDGSLPLNPLSILGGAVTATANLRDEQVVRTTNDLARRLVAAIPGLKYSEQDSELVAKSVESFIPQQNSPLSVHAYLSSIEGKDSSERIQSLEKAMIDNRWPEPNDQLVLSEFLLKREIGRAHV